MLSSTFRLKPAPAPLKKVVSKPASVETDTAPIKNNVVISASDNSITIRLVNNNHSITVRVKGGRYGRESNVTVPSDVKYATLAQNHIIGLSKSGIKFGDISLDIQKRCEGCPTVRIFYNRLIAA